MPNPASITPATVFAAAPVAIGALGLAVDEAPGGLRARLQGSGHSQVGCGLDDARVPELAGNGA